MSEPDVASVRGRAIDTKYSEGIKTAPGFGMTPRELNEEIKKACRAAGEALRALYRAMREGEEWKD